MDRPEDYQMNYVGHKPEPRNRRPPGAGRLPDPYSEKWLKEEEEGDGGRVPDPRKYNFHPRFFFFTFKPETGGESFRPTRPDGAYPFYATDVLAEEAAEKYMEENGAKGTPLIISDYFAELPYTLRVLSGDPMNPAEAVFIDESRRVVGRYTPDPMHDN